MKLAVLGAGAWGTAISILLANNFSEISLWSRNNKVIQSLNNNRCNEVYLPDFQVSNNIKSTNSLIDSVNLSNMIMLSVPTQALRSVCEILKNTVSLPSYIPLIICCKGIELETLKFPTEIVKEFFPYNPVLVLSGPSFAKEIAQNLPCSIVLAGEDKSIADNIIRILTNKNLYLQYTDDILGVQISAALKNVIAIACGIVIGKNIGYNALAYVITNGINEIKSLMLKKNLKVNTDTLIGIACMGDLVLTCTVTTSRNMSFGIELGQGKDINQLSNKASLVEGIKTAKSLYNLSQQLGITLPICEAVYKLIYEKYPLNQAIENFFNIKTLESHTL